MDTVTSAGTSFYDFMQEYPSLRIKPNADCHDRLIVLDYGEPTEQAYHCGASSKDAGKKLCAINVILETRMPHSMTLINHSFGAPFLLKNS